MNRQKFNPFKISISMQIALTFLCLLAMVIGICIFANSVFLKDFYVENKKGVLEDAYTLLDDTLSGDTYDDSALKSEILRICEKYNISMVVMNSSTDAVISSVDEIGPIEKQLFGNMFGRYGKEDSADDRILQENELYTIRISSDRETGREYIEMWGSVGNEYIFMMRTAIDSITDSVSISNRFLLIIGMAAAVISILISILASKRISKPLCELADISERMKSLDFDAQYTGKASNEINVLGQNINELSSTLEKTISELKSANVELEHDLEKRTQLDEMRREFLSNVSHELKTPIALIRGYAEGLEACVADDEESRAYYCEVIEDEAQKMNVIVQKLMALNQLEFGNEKINMEHFDVVILVQNYLQASDILIKRHEAKLRIIAPDTVGVWADQYMVEEAFDNYFTNALNHLDGNKNIDITISVSDGKARVSVFNTGEKIPEEAIPYLWDKFYKVDKARTREYGGSGVGLSIVKAIMESLNQSYGVINHENGVEFYFELEM